MHPALIYIWRGFIKGLIGFGAMGVIIWFVVHL